MGEGGFSKKRNFLIILTVVVLVAFFIIFFNRMTGNWGKFSSPNGYIYTCSSCNDCNDAIVNASAGDTIQLTSDLMCGGPYLAITNKTSITFDCSGYAINSPTGYALTMTGSNNSIIKNCNNASGSGIYLSYSINNTLTNITSSNHYLYGIYLYFSNNNTLTNITASSDTNSGIYISNSSGNTLINLTAANNGNNGVFFSNSDNNTIKNSYMKGNTYALFFEGHYLTNLFYNNFFNNTYNFNIMNQNNLFNTTKISGTNIIGGPYLGGNFWGNIYGVGFSQNCTNDSDGDFICDNPYIFNYNSNSTDYLPLIYGVVNVTNITCTENWSCGSWGACVGSIQNRTCTDTSSCGTTTTKPTTSQACSVSTNVTSNCYQESANVSTSCGGLNNGTYLCYGPWLASEPCFYAYDGSWSTEGSRANATEIGLFINYTKPTGATSAYWQVKDDYQYVRNQDYNLSIPDACWNANPTKLQLKVNSTFGPLINWLCYNGNSWQALRTSPGTATQIYEEAIIWNPIAPTTSNNGTTSGGNSGGGGGGGGGGNTGANSTSGVGTNVTQVIPPATSNQSTVVAVNDSQIYLTKITLNVLQSIQSASVTITKVNVLDDANLKLGLPSGQFYQAFKINTSGVGSSNIANATIEFKVNKNWLASQNGTTGDIKLYRRPDTSTSWNSLDTNSETEDNDFYYFTSFSPGFSTFAVFFQPCQGVGCITANPNQSKWFYSIIGVIAFVIIVIIFFIVRKVRKK